MNANRLHWTNASRYFVFGLMLLLACLAVPAAAATSGRSRIVTPLLENWHFYDGSLNVASASSVTLDDRAWQKVSLPHSWNVLGEYGPKRSAKTRNRQGEGWYRLTLDGKALPQRSRHFLQFDAVGNVADLWVNGIHIGRHGGAFSRFRFDITAALNRQGKNIIAIRADNSRPAPGSPTQDIAPLQGDFFIHGGLYRPVSLISVGDAHFDLLDHGSSGIYIQTVALASDRAQLLVKSLLKRGENRDLRIRTTITDSAGGTVVQSSQAIRGDIVMQPVSLRDPHRWNGRLDPYLYTATVELFDRHGMIDRVRQQFGVRSATFDAARGFFLNGRHLPLHGVSRHQDYLGRGWQLSRIDHERDMALIKELGANTIRMAHYQHADDWFELADRAGMIVWAEIPFVNKPSFGNAPATPELVANAREQLIELIRQNYNHPSVVTWGLGNETDIDLAFGRLGPKADPRPLLDELHRVARAEDPGRPTVIADCCESTPSVKVADHPMVAGHAELMGYNRYFGWYYGKTGDFGPHLDLLHERHPMIPISVSEYGAGAALTQHSDNPEGGLINSGGRPHPEEYQAWFHERSWPQLKERPFIWASWIWNMFDFSSTARNEGDATDINDKGLISFDRKVKKDAFYYYQAQWRDDVPVLHITGRRYVDRAYPVTDVRIYSNLGDVSLFLNGTAISHARCVDKVCLFRDVRLRVGANHLEARAVHDGATITDSLDWNAPDPRAGLSIKVGDLAGYVDKTGRRVGSDNWFIGGTPHKSDRLRGSGAATDPFNPPLTYRSGQFRYAIPVPNGEWKLSLTFVGAPEASGNRAVEVRTEGSVVVRALAPKNGETLVKSFNVTVADQNLDLEFGGNIALAAIDIRPLMPVR